MKNAAYSLKKIQVLGISRDFNTCECCGKTELTKVVRILDLESEVVMNFGTTCAAKADKYDTLEALKAAKAEINKAVRAYDDKVKSANIITYSALKRAFGVTRQSTGEWTVNATEDVINRCFQQAMAHLDIPFLKRGGFTYTA